MKKRLCLAFMLLFFARASLFAQSVYNVTGKVTTHNWLPLANADIRIAGSATGVLTDSSGAFKLKIAAGLQKILISAKGMTTDTVELDITHDTILQIQVKAELLLNEVTVNDNRQATASLHHDDGTVVLTKENFNSLPAFLGENDPIHAMQMQPGVQSGGEGARGIFVRGGGPDQTLILLDGAPVYNPSHIDGFLSVFNGDAIETAEIYKDLYPARYAGRLSSVVDIKMQEGDTARISGSISVGLLISRFHVEGPLSPNHRLTFAVSARGCYAGLYTAPLSKAQFQSAGSNGAISYYFADVNAKVCYHFSAKAELQFNFFANNDFYNYSMGSKDSSQGVAQQSYNQQKVSWANYTASIRLLQTLSAHWKIVHQLSFSRYNITSYEKNTYSASSPAIVNGEYYDNYSINTSAWLNDFTWHSEAEYTGHGQTITTGAGITGMLFKTGGGTFDVNNTGTGDLYEQLNGTTQQSLTAYIYAQDEYRPCKRWVITGSVRASIYTISGKTFPYILPGASVTYNPVSKLYLRAAGCGVSQNMHLLTTGQSNILNDYWVPATATAKPETGWNFSGGLMQKLPLNFEWSVDGFYRLMNNVIDYTQAIPQASLYEPWQTQVTTGGTGRSYGSEFYVARSKGRVTGSIAYTLAWSDRQFASLNGGNYFSYAYDRRHNLAAQVSVLIGRHVELGADWVYGSGNMITLPTLSYQTLGSVSSYYQAVLNNTATPGIDLINVYSGKNNYRLPSYQHLDVSVTYHKRVKRIEHVFNFSIYNVYNHFNQFAIYPVIQTNANGTSNIVYKQISVFPTTPSLTYTVKFG